MKAPDGCGTQTRDCVRTGSPHEKNLRKADADKARKTVPCHRHGVGADRV